VKLLVVGDVHAVATELQDCATLVGFVLEVAEQTKPDLILFLGDQFHNHSIVHVDVLAFWKAAFIACRKSGFKVAALVGNHDMTGLESNQNHAMLAYTSDITVVDKPMVVGGVLLLPYYFDPKAFVEACVAHSDCSTVICHQTFQGGTYDNGFYAKDGVNLDEIPQKSVVSGHIHKPQSFGKCFYPGSPRWRTLSDANEERAIWLLKYEAGNQVDQTAFSTGANCRRVWYFVDTVEAPVKLPSVIKDQWRIDIKGSQEYVQARKQELQGPGVQVRCFPDQQANTLQVRESEGVEKAFTGFMDRYLPKYGTTRDVLEKMAKERLGNG